MGSRVSYCRRGVGGLEVEEERSMDEVNGVAAFAPKGADRDNSPVLTLFHRPNDPSVQILVKRSDITKIIAGGEEGGQVLLQVLLKPGAVVETKIEMLQSVRNIQDPTLKHLTAAAISTVSSLPGN